MDQAAVRRAIARKRDGERLDDATWAQLVGAYLDELFDDAQMAALLMACAVRGLDAEETHALTAAFVASGETLVAPDPRTVDKHSTGGVGDTASLVVVPLVAACGYPVAKLSGRALGHTGGTLDKLEAVPGVHTNLSPERFFACVAEAGCAIAAQSERLVPADKRIYALRDRTATVDSPGLIATSIVSKKIAGGAPSIVYDVKTGRGALLARSEEAEDLARSLIALTRAFGRRAAAVISDMNEPLGTSIGTGLEAIEARDFLRGLRRDPRLSGVCLTLATTMLALAGFNGDASAAVERALASGAAAERFERMLRAQGAQAGALEALQPHASVAPALAERDGIVLDVDAVALGELARELVLRAGPLAGIIVEARIGASVRRGDTLARVYGETEFAGAAARAFVLGDGPVPPRPLIYDVTT